MSAAHHWPIAVAALGPVAAGTTLWRLSGQLHVTVVVKATMAFQSEGAMVVAPPAALEMGEKHGAGGPIGSLCAIRETVPGLLAVDVVVYGHAYAPARPDGNRSATETKIRIAVARYGRPLFDKSLLVFGNRRSGAGPEPFERIPMTYEHALGGIGFEHNPLGKGVGTSSDSQPNVVHPDDPTGSVAAVGPVPSSFPMRKRLLGGAKRKALEQPIAEIPAGFDWAYFQCAPLDQRPAELHGDEWLVLEGLTPDQPILRTHLPSLTAVARIYGAEQAGLPELPPLRADTLQLEPDRGVCSVLWRGSFPIADESVCASLVVAAGLQGPGHPIEWPASVADLRPSTAAAIGTPPPVDPSFREGTALIEAGSVGASQATPFAPASPTGPPAPARSPSPPADGTLPPSDGTFVLDPTQLQAAAAQGQTPFTAVASSGRPKEQPAVVPGAPWSSEPVRAVPAVSSPHDGTMNLSADDVAHATASPAPQPPPPIPALVPDDAQEAAAQEAAAQEAAAQEAAAQEAAAQEAAAQEAAAQEAADRRAAAEKAAAEAEARREEEAKRFAAQQEATRQREQQRQDENRAARRQAAKTLRQSVYGGFQLKKRDQ